MGCKKVLTSKINILYLFKLNLNFMNIGVLGTGVVGNTIGTKLIDLGHFVMMGSRSAMNEKAAAFVQHAGSRASHGTFAEAAAFGEVLFNCAKGDAAIDMLKMAGEENMKGKILVDISNPLDFSKGFPPTLTICNNDSLGELIQRTFPSVHVVKALNTMNCMIMINPAAIKSDHAVFMCGNNEQAKLKVEEILTKWFGWREVIDLGDITNSRGTEMVLPLWIRLYGKFQHSNFNFHIAMK
jgi:8-hydroxy-5-deazaflavin:NADPH oxidoreductase